MADIRAFRVSGIPKGTSKLQIETALETCVGPSFRIFPIVSDYNDPDTASCIVTFPVSSTIDQYKKVEDLKKFWINCWSDKLHLDVTDDFTGATTLIEPEHGIGDFDIIFVHGLGGHAFHTWCARPSKGGDLTMWPADLLFDSLKRKGFNCRVVLFGHDASPKYPKGVSSNIREIASKLVRHVENAQPHDRVRPIFFVCHSMGGLVVCQAIATALSLQSHATPPQGDLHRFPVQGTVFFSTPFQGSAYASKFGRLVGLMGGDDLIVSVLRAREREVGEMMARVYEIRLRRPDHVPDVLICSEKYAPCHLRYLPPVVSQTSAAGKFPKQSTELSSDLSLFHSCRIAEDHVGMTKFSYRSGDLREIEDFLNEAISRRVARSPPAYQEAWQLRRRPSGVFPVNPITASKPPLLPTDVPETPDTSLTFSSSFPPADNTREVRWSPQIQEIRRPAEGTCRWILEDQTFRDWRSGPAGGVLFIEGPLGYGKSVLTRSIIEELEKDKSENFLVTYFFCRDQEGRNTPVSILSGILAQIFLQYPSVKSQCLRDDPKIATLEYLWAGFTRARPLVPKRLVVIIYALDECIRPGADHIPRDSVDKFVRDLGLVCAMANTEAATKLLVVTRSERSAAFHEAVGNKYPWLSLDTRNIQHDVEIVVNDRIRRFLASRRLPDSFTDDMVKAIVGNCGGHFKMAMAMIEALKADEDNDGAKESLLAAIKKMDLTKSLRSIYEEILSLIPAGEIKNANTALKVVYFAKRPLTDREIEHALTILKVDYSRQEDVENFDEKIPYRVVGTALLASCRPLLHVVELPDGKGREIQILNQVMKDCLRQRRGDHTLDLGDDSSGNLLMAEICLKYLLAWLPSTNYENSSNNRGDDDKELLKKNESTSQSSQPPFLRYAAQYWMIHVREAGYDIDKILSLLSELMRFDQPNSERWWKYYCNEISEAERQWAEPRIPEEIIIVRFDLLNVLQHSRTTVSPLRRLRNFFRGNRKYRKATKIRLSHKLKIDITTSPGKGNLLHLCAFFNSRNVMDYLIGCGLSLKGRDSDNDTPFSAAARSGHEELALSLLKRGAGFDNDDPSMPTVMMAVAFWNMPNLGEEVLKRIPGVVNVRQGSHGYTPLHGALFVKNASMVEWLLRHEADPHSRGDDGIQPIHLAAASGELEIFTTVARCVPLELSVADAQGRTPLHFAASCGSAAIVRVLLGTHHVSPTKTEQGWNPIHYAAFSGSVPAVEALSSVQDLCEANGDGFTPIHFAAYAGATMLVEWLLDHGVPPDIARNPCGHTALMIAVEDHFETVEALLNKGADAGATEVDGWTVLHHAAASGSLDIVDRLLKEKPYIENISQITCDGSTALSLAIESEKYDIAEVLLKHFPPDEVNNLQGGATLLFHAVNKGNDKLINKLVEMHADPSIGTVLGNTIVHAIAVSGRRDLLDKAEFRSAVNANFDTPNCMDERPIHVAAKFDNTEVLEYLVKKTKDINAQTRFGSTALIAATKRLGNTCAAILLEHGAATTNRDVYGFTAIEWGLEIQTKRPEANSASKERNVVTNISSLPPNYRHEANIRASIVKELKTYTAAEVGSRDRWVCLVVIGYLLVALKKNETAEKAFKFAAHAQLYKEFYRTWYCLQCKRRILQNCRVCYTCLSMMCSQCCDEADDEKVVRWPRGCQSDHDFLQFNPDLWVSPGADTDSSKAAESERMWAEEMQGLYADGDRNAVARNDAKTLNGSYGTGPRA